MGPKSAFPRERAVHHNVLLSLTMAPLSVPARRQHPSLVNRHTTVHTGRRSSYYLDMAAAATQWLLLVGGNLALILIGVEKGLERLSPLDAGSCVQGSTVNLKLFVFAFFFFPNEIGLKESLNPPDVYLDVFIIYNTIFTSHS